MLLACQDFRVSPATDAAATCLPMATSDFNGGQLRTKRPLSSFLHRDIIILTNLLPHHAVNVPFKLTPRQINALGAKPFHTIILSFTDSTYWNTYGLSSPGTMSLW